jgi:hypothetical protein
MTDCDFAQSPPKSPPVSTQNWLNTNGHPHQ